MANNATKARASVRLTKLSGAISVASGDIAANPAVQAAEAKAKAAAKAARQVKAAAKAQEQASVLERIADLEVQQLTTGEALLMEMEALKLLAQNWKVLPDNKATKLAYDKEVARLELEWENNPSKFTGGYPLDRWENSYQGFRLPGALARAQVKHGEKTFADVIDFYEAVERQVLAKQAAINLLLSL